MRNVEGVPTVVNRTTLPILWYEGGVWASSAGHLVRRLRSNIGVLRIGLYVAFLVSACRARENNHEHQESKIKTSFPGAEHLSCSAQLLGGRPACIFLVLGYLDC